MSSQNINQDIEQIIRDAGNKIISEIGLGHSEMIYQKCLWHYLNKEHNFKVEIEKTYPVVFDEIQIGYCRPDLVINNTIILEIKTTLTLSKQSKVQLQKYDKYCEIAFLVNFPPQVGTTDIELFKQEIEINTNLN